MTEHSASAAYPVPEEPAHCITLRFLAEPTSVNFGGKVHGGAVMKWIDEAGYACATRWSGRYCVTVYVGGIRFFRPIHVGHLVEIRARLIMTGRTSMHILTEVRAVNPRTSDWQQTTRCLIVFTAVDDAGKPVPVQAWTPTSDEEHALEDYARRMKAHGEQMEDVLSPPG